MLLLLNGDYERSLSTVNEALDANPNDVALTRMKFFDLYELNRYNEVKEAMDHHMGKHTVDANYLLNYINTTRGCS